jgi:hypothetical protein
MSNRKELVAGAVFALLLIICCSLITFDGLTASLRVSPPPVTSVSIARIIAWAITGYSALVMVILIIIAAKGGAYKNSIDQRFTARFTIPGHFVFALVPIAMGLALGLFTGYIIWGIFLACSSVPMLIVFFVIALKAKSKVEDKE